MQISRKILEMHEAPQGVLKQMIDKLYAKEKQYVYAKQNPRDECLDQSSIIFNLEKCHDLKPKESWLQKSVKKESLECPVLGTQVKF